MKKNRGFLRWPWNVALYVLLIVALRLFAIPVILLLVWVQQKNNPNGAAEGIVGGTYQKVKLSRPRRSQWIIVEAGDKRE